MIGSSAEFSADGRYRYELWRCWNPGPPGTMARALHVIGLNPSTADAEHDDPTVRRCIGFAKRLGFEQLAITNLFAYRATAPADMRSQEDPVGPLNDGYIVSRTAWADMTIVAWGTHGEFLGRHRAVSILLANREWEPDIQCFGLTAKGYPRHPLYLPNSATLQPYL